MTMKTICSTLLAGAVPMFGGHAMADIILFDDAPKNGASYWAASGSSSGPTTDGDPIYSGATAIKTRQGNFSQAGLQGIGSIPEGLPILRVRYYRTSGSGGQFSIRYSSGWTQLWLQDSGSNDNSAHWTIDGVSGYANNTAGEWHTLEIDLEGLGLSSINAFGTGNSGGDDYWYFDDVAWVAVPEPASLALLSLGATAVAARRRRPRA